MTVTDRSDTPRNVAQHIESVTHHSVSARTIRCHLLQRGLPVRRSLLGLPLTQNHRRRRQCTHCGTLNSQRYISEVLQSVVLPYLEGLATAIFQQDNARPHVARIVKNFFINHQIELLPWPANPPDLSPIENMWSMVAQRLTQITTPAATPDQLWQRVEAAWSAVPQEHIQSLFESMPRRVAACSPTMATTLATDFGRNHTSQKSLNLII
ncbi:transposable element Tcb1 transposase [Trichonephila clavipes]|nr:transposable element Tcb1 transposase [Trichonephila clavipes]